MKIVIPKVIVDVDLEEYALELKGQRMFCWVNLPMNKLEEYSGIITDLYEEAFEQQQGKAKKLSAAAKFKVFVAERREKPVERIEPQKLQWFADVFSQGPEGTHWSLEEFIDLEEKDPGFLSWMISTYWQKRKEYLENKKKA